MKKAGTGVTSDSVRRNSTLDIESGINPQNVRMIVPRIWGMHNAMASSPLRGSSWVRRVPIVRPLTTECPIAVGVDELVERDRNCTIPAARCTRPRPEWRPRAARGRRRCATSAPDGRLFSTLTSSRAAIARFPHPPFTSAPVTEEHHAVAEGAGLGQSRTHLGASRLEERLAPSNDDRADIDPELVDQAVTHECRGEVGRIKMVFRIVIRSGVQYR